jgi:L-seryl-tRNA(Ser) seleniumtransferase
MSQGTTSADGAAREPLLRDLPSVDAVLRGETCAALLDQAPRWAVARAVRDAIAEARARVRAGGPADPEIGLAALSGRVAALLAPSLRRVLNATGVVLHTNLGRAPLCDAAIDQVRRAAAGYTNLEYSLAEGRRGSRHDHVRELLRSLCGAEEAVVTNNNAAAVLLSLAALAAGREVVVSRGELVEIGGSFRIPDVMRASGARLVEVGTTNKTHGADYRDAIGADTALLLKVHRSNFALLGFTAEVGVAELVEIGRERGVPTMVDLGSGSLLDLASLGLPAEPTAPDVVRGGADLVTFSGDKLLGGPQAGVVVGGAGPCERVRRHPLMRAMRPDKLTLAALQATLQAYRDGTALATVPVLRMLAAPAAELRRRADELCGLVHREAPALRADVVEVISQVGGGALPLAAPRSFAVAVVHDGLPADGIDRGLRAADPPVVARIEDGRVLLDVRCLGDHDLVDVSRALGSLGRA